MDNPQHSLDAVALRLNELADRCEAATGPDRRLDTLIEIALDPDRQWIIGEKPGRFPRAPIYGPLSSLWDWASDLTKAPPEISTRPFTGSLDAAMSLASADQQVSVLLNAINACRSDGDAWLKDLPRFVAAEALRARAGGSNDTQP